MILLSIAVILIGISNLLLWIRVLCSAPAPSLCDATADTFGLTDAGRREQMIRAYDERIARKRDRLGDDI